jgi:hypothetical protein
MAFLQKSLAFFQVFYLFIIACGQLPFHMLVARNTNINAGQGT